MKAASSLKPEGKVLRTPVTTVYFKPAIIVCECVLCVCVMPPLNMDSWNALRARQNTGLPKQLARAGDADMYLFIYYLSSM